mgnify:CR=1 FL=1
MQPSPDPFVRDVSWRFSLLSALLIVGFSLFGLGCGDEDGDGDDVEPNMTVEGTVQALTQQGQTTTIEGATVIARSDRDGDGEIANNERFRGETDQDGNFQIRVAARANRSLVLTVRADNFAEQHRRVRIRTLRRLRVNAQLVSSQMLECRARVCNTEDGSLSVRGIPSNAIGTARVIDPSVESDAFAGDFNDADGNLLVAGVSAVLQLRNQQGNRIGQLDDPATVEVRFPRGNWSAIRDIEEDNDQIDVPLYLFDEATGEWRRQGRGLLVDGEGEPISESDLDEINDGDFDDAVFVRAQIRRTATFAFAWRVESPGAVRGTLVDADGDPVEGAAVDVAGVTYPGRAPTVLTGEDGTFCVPVLRSEQDDEDLDGDGESGETHRVSVRARFQEQRYGFGDAELPTAPATCQQGALNLEQLRLTEQNRLQVQLCEATVEVVDAEGEPVEGASVFANDPAITADVFFDFCIDDQNQNQCELSATSDDDGRAQLRIPLLERISYFGVQLGANPDAQFSSRNGTRSRLGCPAQPVQVRLDQGVDVFSLAISISGNQLSWQPDVPANWILVGEQDGTPKWWLFSEESRIPSGLDYGDVPTGTVQVIPQTGDPEPLAGGDRISILATQSSSEGIFEQYQATIIVE